MQTAHISYCWVDSNAALAQICAQASQHQYVALDTEFVRVRTYYATLGLIQLYDGEILSLIDPLSIDNFEPFIQLLSNPRIVKILHAASEDLEIFQYYFNQLPMPLMDTQILANFVGLGDSIGLAKLVEHYCSIVLDKNLSRTNWLTRPLSDAYLQYAAADVWYLLPIYHTLMAQIVDSGWEEAAKEENQRLLEKLRHPTPPELAYLAVKNVHKLSRFQLAILRALTIWRIKEAQKRNLPLNFILKTEILWQIAYHQPQNALDLQPFISDNERRRYGNRILNLIKQVRKMPDTQYPALIHCYIEDNNHKTQLHLLKNYLAKNCPPTISLALLSNNRMLNQLIKWYNLAKVGETPELLKGWRKPFGEQLLNEMATFLSKHENDVT